LGELRRHAARPPRCIADPRLLDLDHLGAELPEQRRRERTGDDLSGVDHAHPGEGVWLLHQ
jgi:hypothetical protein